MSETPWKVKPGDLALARVDGPGVSILVDHDGGKDAENALAERIARLLTEDDERIEREAMLGRLMGESLAVAGGDVADAAWVRWEAALKAKAPLAELRALESAYCATLPQERVLDSIEHAPANHIEHID